MMLPKVEKRRSGEVDVVTLESPEHAGSEEEAWEDLDTATPNCLYQEISGAKMCGANMFVHKNFSQLCLD